MGGMAHGFSGKMLKDNTNWLLMFTQHFLLLLFNYQSDIINEFHSISFN